jgi:hypothetical protein
MLAAPLQEQTGLADPAASPHHGQPALGSGRQRIQSLHLGLAIDEPHTDSIIV